MQRAYANQLPITPPDSGGEGLQVSSETDRQNGPTGSFFVIEGGLNFDCKIFTRSSSVEEIDPGTLILISKSEKDIGGVVLELVASLELLPEEADLEAVNESIREQQDEVEQIAWQSSRGHYDPIEANELRQQTRHLEKVPLLREAKRLCVQRPVERNKLVEMTVRRLVLNESMSVDHDAVQ